MGMYLIQGKDHTIPNYRLFHSGLSFSPSHPISRELSIVSPELPELFY